jgi:hypothetical protein
LLWLWLWLGLRRRQASLSALFAHLLPFGGGDGAIVIQVLRVEAGERLGLELLERDRLRTGKSLRDHPLNPSPAAWAGELRSTLIGLGAGQHAIMVGVQLLEHHICHLLGLLAGEVPLHETAAASGRLRQCRR